ncbi:hypothetical protein DFH05DRAFT_1459912 [Lentinula detonsa]|uniref:Uncharacterized protein n=1 Tax=Lentinula detonsa TaxID=2804962 RepID=A0A9W8P1J8_9AGAR|nr:hypothetical protein DFH05DRAFT_1459912 [Lentinula detonsa]
MAKSSQVGHYYSRSIGVFTIFIFIQSQSAPCNYSTAQGIQCPVIGFDLNAYIRQYQNSSPTPTLIEEDSEEGGMALLQEQEVQDHVHTHFCSPTLTSPPSPTPTPPPSPSPTPEATKESSTSLQENGGDLAPKQEMSSAALDEITQTSIFKK